MILSTPQDIKKNESIQSQFSRLYGESAVEDQTERYARLIERHRTRFGEKEMRLFSAPGRTEIGGNHTDHNAGRVLAAAVDLDAIAAATPVPESVITLYSEGYADPFVIRLNDLAPRKEETGSTASLIRGIASRFQELQYAVGGFDATVESRVAPGSGLSSSASFETLVGSILNGLCNHHSIPAEEIAQIGQYAENRYFGKPCGLMDQLTSAVGGVVAIDFRDAAKPEVERIRFDFDSRQFGVLVVNTGGSHADLTDDYASIPEEMQTVARYFGKAVLRDISQEELLNHIPELREQVGDRAVLRAFHFLGETERVLRQVDALKRDDLSVFLRLVRESGESSFRWLQNAYSIQTPAEQGISVGLALAEDVLKDRPGAWRVHGGGFAGTIQIIVREEDVPSVSGKMRGVFGKDSVTRLRIRPEGAVEIG